MAKEEIAATLRNEPRSKVDLIFSADGWMDKDTHIIEKCWIIRSINISENGEVRSHSIRLRAAELVRLIDALDYISTQMGVG